MSIFSTDIVKINGNTIDKSIDINDKNVKFAIAEGDVAKLYVKETNNSSLTEMVTDSDDILAIEAKTTDLTLVHLVTSNGIKNNKLAVVNLPASEQTAMVNADGSKDIVYEGRKPNSVSTIYLKTFAYPFAIRAVSTANNTFTVNGDKRLIFSDGDSIDVADSTGNDDTWTISTDGLAYNATTDKTVISVDEDVTNAVADGTIAFS